MKNVINKLYYKYYIKYKLFEIGYNIYYKSDNSLNYLDYLDITMVLKKSGTKLTNPL